MAVVSRGYQAVFVIAIKDVIAVAVFQIVVARNTPQPAKGVTGCHHHGIDRVHTGAMVAMTGSQRCI